MLFGIQEFLLNMLFIILAILAYQVFWADRIKQIQRITVKKNQYMILLLCCISIVLCITFPVSYTDGFRYDLRQIPLLIGTFYGGYLIGMLLTAFTILYRFLLGGGGVVNTVLLFSVFIGIATALRPCFVKSTLKNKLLISSILIGSMSIGPIEIAQYLKLAPYPGEATGLFLVIYGSVSVITVCLAVYLIERLLESVHMRMEIQQAEKMNVIGQLTASIAHEIRNPMTASRGFMQLLKEKIHGEQEQSYAELAISEIDRAQATITEYLSFAKPEMEELEVIEISTHMRNVTSIISAYAAFHNVEIHSTIQPSLFIKGSPGKLTQCFVNLIKNGIEASSGVGKMEIAASMDHGTVVITISDNGIGMEEEQIKRLGTPFYSTKEKGTGLGLMVSYRIINMLDGKIKVKSEKGKGTCFIIKFPAVQLEDGAHG